MENGAKKTGGYANGEIETPNNITIKGILGLLLANIDCNDKRRVISLGMGDPSAYTCFRTADVAEDAVVDALRSQKFNGYSPTVGLPQTRKAISEYLSRDLPYKLSPDDAFVTSGCTQAIDVALSILARPGMNILLPKPGFPIYELCAAFRNLEVRHYNLLPNSGWEVDLDDVEALADHNTVAMAIINPGNPCGNVYSYQHLKKIAETAKRMKIVVIADEVYGHLAFGDTPFVPMGIFGSLVPVLTLGSLSKRWIVPGWRLGWFVINDPCSTFKNSKVRDKISFPRILQQTDEAFFADTINTLKQSSDICYEKIKEVPCITCPYKPEGSMALMVKLNLSLLKDISDDIDFCFKLAKEESVIFLPGITVGMKNWVRITFAVEASSLDEAFGRVKSFYLRHSNQQERY
ncbi:hypothetical protein RHGRI_009637 [Rhododendron griersonianum]|uniref:Aminotransferase class I/classII large domain-containing protein n=1 Tax=Rhododendron griersonianum TaxID=479676 RepID=A0AAV6KG64_9ERIC|nr:hypothetical protein RHGRI_009637 [Rhododendron griersonianum]